MPVNAEVKVSDQPGLCHQCVNLTCPVPEQVKLLCRAMQLDAAKAEVGDLLDLVAWRFIWIQGAVPDEVRPAGQFVRQPLILIRDAVRQLFRKRCKTDGPLDAEGVRHTQERVWCCIVAGCRGQQMDVIDEHEVMVPPLPTACHR